MIISTEPVHLVSPPPNKHLVSPPPNVHLVSSPPNMHLVSPPPNVHLVSPPPNKHLVSPPPNVHLVLPPPNKHFTNLKITSRGGLGMKLHFRKHPPPPSPQTHIFSLPILTPSHISHLT